MTDPKKKAMAEVVAATRATAAMMPAGMPPTKRALRREKTKSRMGAEAHDPAVTHLKLEKTHDYHEAAHDGCITEPPKLQTVSFDVGGLEGVRAKSGSGIGDEGLLDVGAPSRSSSSHRSSPMLEPGASSTLLATR